MGDVITRFRLETNQFDSKLRDASQEMSKLSQQLQIAGKDFDRFAQKHVEAAKALGQTESGATNLKDKLRDLVSAYNNVAKAYNNLTADQQKTDFGKAMAASLEQLQQRITQTKTELYGMTDSTKQAGDGLGSLNNIFGFSINKLAGWGAALAAAKGALNIAKDAFFASEANIDEWGRTVESSQATYEAFLTSLNTGDISGYLSRVNQISQAAREAYDALDLLGTQKTIQSPQLAKKQAEITRMRNILQTGVFIEAADGRVSAGGLKTGDKLTKEQLNGVAKQLESAMAEVANITKSQVKSATTAIDRMYEEQALIIGVSKQEYKRVTGSWEEFKAASDMADEYKKWRQEHTSYQTMNSAAGGTVNTIYDDSKNPYRKWAWLSTFKDDGERFQRLVTEIQNREAAKSGLYGQYGQIYRRINKAEGYNPYGSEGSGKEKKEKVEKELNPLQQVQKDIATLTEEALTADEERLQVITQEISKLQVQEKYYKDIQDRVRGLKVEEPFPDLGITEPSMSMFEKAKSDIREQLASEILTVDEATFATLLKDAVRSGIEELDPALQEMREKMAEGLDIPDEAWQKIIDEYNELREKIGEAPIQIDLATGKMKTAKEQDDNNGVKEFKSLIGNVSTITGALEQLGVEVPEGFSKTLGVMQLISTIMMSIQSMATITAGTSALKSIPIIGMFLSGGGIVPKAAGGRFIGGNSYSGDNVYAGNAWVNSGELVLNKSEQGNLASFITAAENGMGAGVSETRVESDVMVMTIKNGARRRGVTVGEYLGIV